MIVAPFARCNFDVKARNQIRSSRALTLVLLIERSWRRRFVIDTMGIVTCQATDILAIDDPVMAKSMTFNQERAFDGIKVPDVVNVAAISRITSLVKSASASVPAGSWDKIRRGVARVGQKEAIVSCVVADRRPLRAFRMEVIFTTLRTGEMGVQ
ncbi:MAG: hypothetical protein WCA27_03585 [Candidatus Sulfotelmatobacter sp.]